MLPVKEFELLNVPFVLLVILELMFPVLVAVPLLTSSPLFKVPVLVSVPLFSIELLIVFVPERFKVPALSTSLLLLIKVTFSKLIVPPFVLSKKVLKPFVLLPTVASNIESSWDELAISIPFNDLSFTELNIVLFAPVIARELPPIVAFGIASFSDIKYALVSRGEVIAYVKSCSPVCKYVPYSSDVVVSNTLPISGLEICVCPRLIAVLSIVLSATNISSGNFEKESEVKAILLMLIVFEPLRVPV